MLDHQSVMLLTVLLLLQTSKDTLLEFGVSLGVLLLRWE
jgi:hypothetical protein